MRRTKARSILVAFIIIATSPPRYGIFTKALPAGDGGTHYCWPSGQNCGVRRDHITALLQSLGEVYGDLLHAAGYRSG
jgi:hypothetical protein